MQLQDLVQKVTEIGIPMNELAIYQNGRIQSHRFRPGDHCSDTYSVAKAFTMTALGILSDDGLLDVEKPISFYMGHLIPSDADPGWKNVTVENALTHRIGFGEGFLDIDVEDPTAYPTEDFLDIVFHHQLKYTPGQKHQYSDAAFYLLSRLVSVITDEPLDVFLNRRLFRPLHFHEVAWSHCPYNYPMGATGLYISAGDAVKLPALYLNKGIWEGKQLLSGQWVQQAVNREYELCRRTPGGWIGKGGMYGQMVMFHSRKNVAVAWLGHTEDNDLIQHFLNFLDT